MKHRRERTLIGSLDRHETHAESLKLEPGEKAEDIECEPKRGRCVGREDRLEKVIDVRPLVSAKRARHTAQVVFDPKQGAGKTKPTSANVIDCD